MKIFLVEAEAASEACHLNIYPLQHKLNILGMTGRTVPSLFHCYVCFCPPMIFIINLVFYLEK